MTGEECHDYDYEKRDVFLVIIDTYILISFQFLPNANLIQSNLDILLSLSRDMDVLQDSPFLLHHVTLTLLTLTLTLKSTTAPLVLCFCVVFRCLVYTMLLVSLDCPIFYFFNVYIAQLQI